MKTKKIRDIGLLGEILYLRENEDKILKDLGLPIKSQWRSKDKRRGVS